MRLAERGHDPDELDAAFTDWNAHMVDDGRIVPDIAKVVTGPRRRLTRVIYCVVPKELEAELYDRLVAYYADNPAVTVIVDRRTGPDRRNAPERGASSPSSARFATAAVPACRARSPTTDVPDP